MINERPIEVRNDKHSFLIYPESGRIQVCKLEIKNSEVIIGRVIWTLKKSDFKCYPHTLKALVKALNGWEAIK